MIEWLRVCTWSFFLLQGRGGIVPAVRSDLGTKTIDIIYQSFLSAPVALGAAELATLKGLVLASMPGLTSGLKLPLKTTKS